MPGIQSLVIARPRFQWGEKLNLVMLLSLQVVAIVVLICVPFLAENRLSGKPDLAAVDRWSYVYTPGLIGLVFLASSIWVSLQRRKDAVGQAYAVFATSTAISLFCVFDLLTSQFLVSIWVVAGALSGGALINLALIYPEQARIKIQHPSLRYLGFFPSAFLIALIFLVQVYSGSRNNFDIILFLELIFISLALIFFFISTLVRRLGSPSPMVREQARLILAGYGIAFGPLILIYFAGLISSQNLLSPAVFFFISLFPIFLTYAILKYRVLDSQSLLKRGIIYGVLLVFIAGSYGLIVSGLSLLAGTRIETSNPFITGTIVFLITLLVYPLRSSLQSRIDAAFFKGGEVLQSSLQDFGHELTRMTNFASIMNLMKEHIEKSLSPSRILIYTIQDGNNYYTVFPEVDGTRGSEIQFARSGALVDLLTSQGKTFFVGDVNKLPQSLMVDQARIAILQVELLVPVIGGSGLLGWLALGPRRSGEPFSSYDIHYLESLCDQASLALERSQVFSALEQRIHEMDTITKVAAQINQKLELDELLNMFYSETRNLVPTVDFRITLKSNPIDDFHHVFYISNNKRMFRRENQPFLAGNTLETAVIKNQHPIVTVDYAGECRRRKLTAESREIHAWMSVPLNAGVETIGAVCVGSRDPEIIYSSEEVNLLQAVADLVAGAIVKTRLLDESRKQAHQMATINELSRSLTSTLELTPLLNRIMESAVEILNCEAGSLLLVDEETSESVFKVAVGPVGTDLVGKRLPMGAGLVGKAIDTKQAIIENDVRQNDAWFNADVKTGFSSRDLLVVPLMVKDHVIGVMEVLNKEDGSPFNHKDLDLLSAFAGQMAVSIENARLYTQTDQALAARVEELSIMQHIDQELNASLEINQVMEITLESAMRYSKASAGLIGSLSQDGFFLAAERGFPSRDMDFEGEFLHERIPGLENFLKENHSGPVILQPAVDVFIDQDAAPLQIEMGDAVGLTSDQGKSDRVLVPIWRKSEVSGLIYLVNTRNSGFSADDIDFLSRLSDHASIAISNAQLYAELREANSAKSEFVSSAAHELKNPLTSIKGYSDLLVKGTVGPVNDGQAGFLKTIRSNAERMDILVSDLQDISRIEADQLLLEFSRVPLEEIITEVISTLETQIDQKSQQLTLQVPGELPLIWCDTVRMVQVFTNLVSNAIKYTQEGGQIEIRAELVESLSAAEEKRTQVKVSITDNGFGISKADQEQIFEQFFRSEDSRVRESTGTGLGLSISKKLVELQGGELWFESEIGRGTTFFLTVPTAEQA